MPISLHSILWVLDKQHVEIVDQVLTAHFEGRKLDIEAIEARMGRNLNNERKEYVIDDGVAVIPMHGVIGKRMNMFTRISGGVSTEKLQQDIQTALDDRQVKAVVLDIDSPGGTVDGTKELSDWLFSVRGQKPMFGYANGTMMSGAVWIGTALDRVYGYDSTMAGSISVAQTHYDRSKADEKWGVKRKFITSGKYKRIANDAEPLSAEAEEYLQQQVDGIHALFVEGVARNLGLPVETVAAFSEGKVYLGAEAVSIGMLHGIKTLAETKTAAREAADTSTPGGRMNAQEIREQFPEAAASLVEEGRSVAAQEIEGAVVSERDRVTGLCVLVAGEDTGNKVSKLAASGITAEQAETLTEAGLSTKDGGNDNEQQSRQDILDALKDTDTENVGTGAVGEPTEFMAAVEQYKVEHPKASRIQAMQAVRKAHPDLHKKFIGQEKK